MKPNRHVAAMLVVALIVAGCAHTTPNPVALAQVGDDAKSCDAIANEMQQMVNTQTEAAGERNKQIGGNVALGIAGAFLIVPWFFMDLGNAATVEEKAAQARYQRLAQMQADRKCPPVPPAINASAPANTATAAPAVQTIQPSPPLQPAPTTPSAAATPPQAVPAVLQVSGTSAGGPSAGVPVAPATPVAAAAPPSAGSSTAVAQATGGSPQGVTSKRMFSAERFAKVSGCEQPVATVNISAATYETFTVRCSNLEPMSIRCDDSACRELK